jgi:hypothetical protein
MILQGGRMSPTKTLLEGYRVLDLTDEKGLLASRILADMGAEGDTPAVGKRNCRFGGCRRSPMIQGELERWQICKGLLID